jgi:nitroimidazol reductase NimA-like FMN-containing flavoprotein (pyridoxamine 5'-phosphate oxidase superfamily)
VTVEKQEGPWTVRPRRVIDLTASECWKLLSGASIGRVVFTHHAMPAIRPVNHLVDARTIIIRTHLGAAIASRAAEGKDDGTVVCYEADELDPDRHTGWSVIATGLARLVRDSALVVHYAEQLEPWVAGGMDHVVTIEPQFVSGIRLVGGCD